jgi:hypothetical protein
MRMKMDALETHTENASVVFSLDTRCWDFDEGDESEPLRTPELGVYRSAAHAAADRIGLEIVETLDGHADLWFFAADGVPLEAHFSQQPYIDFERNTYFAGVYSLHLGSGTNVFDAIAKIIASNHDRSTQARIVVWIASTDEDAKDFGWPTPEAMKDGVARALRILPPDMQRRLIFANLPYNGIRFSNIEDDVRGA